METFSLEFFFPLFLSSTPNCPGAWRKQVATKRFCFARDTESVDSGSAQGDCRGDHNTPETRRAPKQEDSTPTHGQLSRFVVPFGFRV